jgi:homoserine kinase type II
MAHYSILNKADILEILKPYSIFNIKKFQILDGGSENTNYKIDSEVGKIVLTISEQKTIQEAQHLAELLDHLKKNNFDTSELVHTSQNKSLTKYKNKPVMVKRYLEGKIMSDVPMHLLKQIGADTARLHKISVPDYVRDIMWCGKERFNEVKEYALNSSFDLWLTDTHSYIEKNIASDLPKAFIHTDIFGSNIIISNDETKATIMDFEEATHYFRVFDIAVLFISLCVESGDLDFTRASSILKSYTSVTKLTDEEKQALQPLTVYAAAGVAFWRHKNFNYTNPDDNLKDSYLYMKDLADKVRDLPSSYFKLLHDL